MLLRNRKRNSLERRYNYIRNFCLSYILTCPEQPESANVEKVNTTLAKVSLNEKKKTALQQNDRMEKKPMGRSRKERREEDETMHHYSRPNAAATLFDFLPDDKKPKSSSQEFQPKLYGQPERSDKFHERGGKFGRQKKNFNKPNHFNPRNIGFNAAASDSNYNDSFPNLHNSNPTPVPGSAVPPASVSAITSSPTPVSASPRAPPSRGSQPLRDYPPIPGSKKQLPANDQDFGQWDAGQCNSGLRNYGKKKNDQFVKKKRRDPRQKLPNIGEICLAKYWEDSQVNHI